MITLFTAILVLGFLIAALLWVERGHLLLPSTWPAVKWLGFSRVMKGELFHGLWYGRWIPEYLHFWYKRFPKLSDKRKKWLGDTYHGKVLTPELAKAIVNLDKDVPLQDLGEQVIPYPRARDIVLQASPDIVVNACGCKTAALKHRNEPCKLFEPPYQVCMLIGKPLTDFLLEHHPDTARRITREEALEILDMVHSRGGVHNGWFKDCIKDQFYVICNCCPCCCLGFKSMEYGVRQLISSGYVAKVDKRKCQGCGECVQHCPFSAITITEEGKSRVDWDKCMGCSVCVDMCVNGARKLILDGKKGKPLDVRKLVA